MLNEGTYISLVFSKFLLDYRYGLMSYNGQQLGISTQR